MPDSQRWLRYRCTAPGCGTTIYVTEQAGTPPAPERPCIDCGGRTHLNTPEQQREEARVRRQGEIP